MTDLEFSQKFPNFSMSELACHDADRTPVPKEVRGNYVVTLKIIQFIRTLTGLAIILTSGFRTYIYNISIGGATKSFHTFKACAIDFRFKWVFNTEKRLQRVFDALDTAQRTGMITAGGLHLYKRGKKSFIHLDTRGYNARWSG